MGNKVAGKVKNQIADYYDGLAGNYEDNYSDILCKAEEKALIKLMQPHIQNKVLDIGCGTGLLLDYVRPDQYVGIDISAKMLEMARKKHPSGEFYEIDMFEFLSKQKSESFDTIVSMFGPMSYSLKPVDFINECRRVLKPGGVMMVMPYTGRLGMRLFLNGFSSAVDNEIPKIFYTSAMLRKLFDNFQKAKFLGINYFANFVLDMATEFSDRYDADNLENFLLNEAKTVSLPIEYARHALVIATK